MNPNLNHIKAMEHKVTRCSGFDRDNFNYFNSKDNKGWLEKSARSGFVLAMSEYAKNTLEDSTNGASSAESLSTYKEASNMLFQSIEQGGGEVYFNVAQIINNKVDQLAWSLLACRTGMNCADMSWNMNREMAVYSCLLAKPATDCFDKADFNYLIQSSSTPDEIKAATTRSYKIARQLKNKNFRDIGLNPFLKYLDKN